MDVGYFSTTGFKVTDKLFDLPGQQSAPANAEVGPAPIMKRQIDQIRELFKAAGIEDQTERRSLVESVAGVNVAELRSLSRFQGLQVIEKLSVRHGQGISTTKRSSWDDREEDTWIDKL